VQEDASGVASRRASRSATPRLIRFAALAIVTLLFGLLTARLEFVVLAVPLVVALAWGLAGSRAPRVRVEIGVGPDRCLEGDEVVMNVAIASGSRMEEAELGVAVPAGFAIGDGAQRVALRMGAGGRRSVVVPVRAARWGVYRLGTVALRTTGPGRFVVYEEIFEREFVVKVFPAFERLDRAVRPPETQVFSGDYTSRAAGEGLEFADVRPFAAGDRLRRLNWRVTSRRDAPFANRHHPERSADVVLLLDTFSDFGPPGASSLDLAVRGAAALARHHLDRKDRVGLVSFGGLLHWLNAASGRTQIYRIVDYLLRIEVELSHAWKDIQILPSGTLPPQALVVAFSPLEDERSITALVDLRGRGFSLVVVDTLSEGAVEPLPGEPGAIAYRAWRMAREGLRFRMATLGIPVVPWSGEEGLDATLAHVPRFRRRSRVS
jgi:uncharacterized protein (DUF58 family)